MARRATAFRVLVATDGSTQARAAITTVVKFPWPVATRVQAVVARPSRGAHIDRRVDSAAASARRALMRRWPDSQVVVVNKTPVNGIISEAKRFRADIIVVGWRGHGTVRRLLMGSVSRGVVRGAACSVLVVRRSPRRVRSIVIGLNRSPGAFRAVTLIGRLVAPQNGRVTLISAVEFKGPSSLGPVTGGIRATVGREVKRINAARTAETTKALNLAAAELKRKGWGTRSLLRNGEPLRELIAAVAKVHPQLLAVGARSSSGVRHLLLGSVAEGVLNRLPVSVLIAR